MKRQVSIPSYIRKGSVNQIHKFWYLLYISLRSKAVDTENHDIPEIKKTNVCTNLSFQHFNLSLLKLIVISNV
jgi:hypothetical protein